MRQLGLMVETAHMDSHTTGQSAWKLWRREADGVGRMKRRRGLFWRVWMVPACFGYSTRRGLSGSLLVTRRALGFNRRHSETGFVGAMISLETAVAPVASSKFESGFGSAAGRDYVGEWSPPFWRI